MEPITADGLWSPYQRPHSPSPDEHRPEPGLLIVDGRLVNAPPGVLARLPEHAAGAVTPPPEHLMQVIEQLATGVTDRTASQRLGLSPRTFSRRVSELLVQLHAESRFQAGVEVALRGWAPRGRRHRRDGPPT